MFAIQLRYKRIMRGTKVQYPLRRLWGNLCKIRKNLLLLGQYKIHRKVKHSCLQKGGEVLQYVQILETSRPVAIGREVKTVDEKTDRTPADSGEDAKKLTARDHIISWGKTLLLAFVLAMLIKTFLVVNAVVVSGSMEETIMTNDRVMCNRLSYVFGEPQRYDIIAFDFTQSSEKSIYVKRIIGLPGETVEIFDGKVYINGSDAPLEDSFVNGAPRGDYGPFEVPEDCVFVLGDNRNSSYDSKSWPDPFLPIEQIQGKAMFRYYPSPKMLTNHFDEE